MSWYYAAGNQPHGPIDEETFQQLVRNGVIGAGTLVWREGMADWKAYGQVKPVAQEQTDSGGEQAGMDRCFECGRAFPRSELTMYGRLAVCGACKPRFVERIRGGEPMLEETVEGGAIYAGFWVRAGAKLVDTVILMIPFLPIGIMMFAPYLREGQQVPLEVQIRLQVYVSVLAVLYNALMIGWLGATVGKMVFGLVVVRSDGGKVGWGRALGRALAEMLSQLPCWLGYVLAAFNEEKRTLHDFLCGTRVISPHR